MNNKAVIYTAVATLLFPLSANASGAIAKNSAKMQAMDKITGRVSVINVPVNGMVEFGSLSIVVRSCKTRRPEETPDNFAFVDISDKTLQGKEFNVFKGWMISSSPATYALEHPIYDVWLLQCLDEKIDRTTLLSNEQLEKRDTLPKQEAPDTTKMAEDINSQELSKSISEMQDEGMQEPKVDTEQTEFFFDEESVDSSVNTLESEN